MSESARLEPDMTTLKSQILKSQIVVILLCLAGSAGAQRWSDQTFAGSVATGYYQAVSGIWAAYTNTGTMTNGVRTNYYRLCGTNPAGRIPLSSNAVFSFTGSTNTNALVLAWTRAPGVNAHVIERSYDLDHQLDRLRHELVDRNRFHERFRRYSSRDLSLDRLHHRRRRAGARSRQCQRAR